MVSQMINKAQAPVGQGLHYYMLEPGICCVGCDASYILPQPLTHTSVGIVVKAVHALWSHSMLYHIAVPALPYSSGTIVDRIEPTWVLSLEGQL